MVKSIYIYIIRWIFPLIFSKIQTWIYDIKIIILFVLYDLNWWNINVLMQLDFGVSLHSTTHFWRYFVLIESLSCTYHYATWKMLKFDMLKLFMPQLLLHFSILRSGPSLVNEWITILIRHDLNLLNHKFLQLYIFP